jgi:hypothetical protein
VISTQDSFARAKQYVTDLLGEKDYTLEEGAQDVYKNVSFGVLPSFSPSDASQRLTS